MILERKALYRKAQADVFAHEDWDILLELVEKTGGPGA
ncbi:hypothetical protein SAMN04488047_12912 [Tranquillimonas alkanivorans]|uniref:Uncharacterized protein n=1 Tax=Tranquillimonas alkanivorans TaxID=441119 RepID=A0A1I5VBP9_9RHOB|nr:hypothetical protein SAMN04488047_12912 [Tranquillimonas alkanivorans]